jgi:hypothetical protein
MMKDYKPHLYEYNIVMAEKLLPIEYIEHCTYWILSQEEVIYI